MTKPSEFLSVQDVARRVGVTTAAVYARIEQGRIPEHRILNRYAVSVADVNAWIAERHAAARAVLDSAVA